MMIEFTTIHVLAGLLSALAVLVSKHLAWIGFMGFEFYEIGQYFEYGDYPTGETMEFMFGLFLGIAILLLFFCMRKGYIEIKRRI